MADTTSNLTLSSLCEYSIPRTWGGAFLFKLPCKFSNQYNVNCYRIIVYPCCISTHQTHWLTKWLLLNRLNWVTLADRIFPNNQHTALVDDLTKTMIVNSKQWWLQFFHAFEAWIGSRFSVVPLTIFDEKPNKATLESNVPLSDWSTFGLNRGSHMSENTNFV